MVPKRYNVNIGELSFPTIWVNGLEEHWFNKAWKILGKQGMTSYSEEDKAGEQKVKLLAVSLGAMYLDFCQMAHDEHACYESWYDKIQYFFPEEEITYLFGALGLYYPDSIYSSLFELEVNLRSSILGALQSELSLVEICLGMYFTAVSARTINNWLYPEDDEEGELDCDCYEDYWYLITHETDLMTSFGEFSDIMPAYEWLNEGAYQIGEI